MTRRRSIHRTNEPIPARVPPPVVMADVVRELETIARLAEDHDAPEVAEACARARTLLERLRERFVFEITGPASPSDLPVDLEAHREQRRSAQTNGSVASKIPAAR